MTIGYYAIRPARPHARSTPSEPWPYCRACARQPGMTIVVPIDETAHPSITCRGCKAKLRAWR